MYTNVILITAAQQAAQVAQQAAQVALQRQQQQAAQRIQMQQLATNSSE